MRRLTRTAVFTAMALALSVVESAVPLGIIVPVPGLKLGFANIVTLFVLFTDGFPTAFAVTLLRGVLGAFFASTGFMSMAYSLAGGLLSLFVMALMKPGQKRVFSLYGISAAGAAVHNAAQIGVAFLMLSDSAVLLYLPLLLIVSLFTGGVTAAAAQLVLARFRKPDLERFLR